MLNIIRKSQTLLCLTVTGLCLILANTIGNSWFKAFIKSGDHRAYLFIFFSLMALMLLLLFPYFKKARPWICLLLGGGVGYLTGFISVFLFGILQSGVSVWVESYISYGINALWAIFWGATVTGSWLIGAVLFYFSRKLYIVNREAKAKV